ncbi:hypothetical protein OIU84_007138 [Salix udensis]|uniref:1,3-beta-glucan synthase component FKS1-like domain-containing protein n=1 Tax=Salix udensis TaxID=889485 RepID=A0AAD6JS70_9ROSI|nr:hypothetical protein OIU84_007138 [Salix udensis]
MSKSCFPLFPCSVTFCLLPLLQNDNVRNQRENIILSIANAQSRLGLPIQADPKIDEKVINEVFLKVLDNYIKWCKYLRKRLAWNSIEAINRDRKIFMVSLYFLIWGEAANVRFLPECMCYIFHQVSLTALSFNSLSSSLGLLLALFKLYPTTPLQL